MPNKKIKIPGKRLVDVLSEQEQQTFLTETIIPKLQKLMNIIRSTEASDIRDKDFQDVRDMVKDMQRAKLPYEVAKSDLKWCNTLYRKYRKLNA